MKLQINKKTIIILVSLVLIIFVFLIFNFTYFSSSQNNYKLLIDYCDKNDKEELSYNCQIFVSGESFNNKKDQITLNYYNYDSSNNTIIENSMTEDKNLVKWENPYPNYDQLIPLDLKIDLKKNLFGMYSVKKFTYSLMSDEDILDILSNASSIIVEGRYLRESVYIKQNQDIIEKGYYLTRDDNSVGNIDNVLVFRNVTIIDIKDEEGVLEIKANLLINNDLKEIEFPIKDKFIIVSKKNYESIEEILNPSDYQKINLESKYFISFKFDPNTFNIVDYITLIEESQDSSVILPNDFILVSIVEIQEIK
jgi:hypothetical protein